LFNFKLNGQKLGFNNPLIGLLIDIFLARLTHVHG